MPWQGRWRQHPYYRQRYGDVPEHEHAAPHKRVRKHDGYPAHQHPCGPRDINFAVPLDSARSEAKMPQRRRDRLPAFAREEQDMTNATQTQKRMTEAESDLYTEACEGIQDSAIAWRKLLIVADLVGWETFKDYLEARAHIDEPEDYLANFASAQEIGELVIFKAKAAAIQRTSGSADLTLA